MISVVLLEPESPGNIGSVARIMANFNFTKLILVNPQCNHLDLEAVKFAKHGIPILKKAKVAQKTELSKFHTVIATTSKLGTDYNIPRSPISPEQLSKKPIFKIKNNIALLFGRESKGLFNDELNLADFIVTIPTSRKYPALNLAQSVNIILYELFKSRPSVSSHIQFASKAEKDQIGKMIKNILDILDFKTPSKKKTQQVIWRRIIGKSFLTKREAFAVMGFLRKLLEK